MKARVILIERKPSESVSIERVFRQVKRDFPAGRYNLEFQSVPFGNGIAAIIKNLLFFRKRPAEIYHVTGDIHYISLLLPKNRTILTIHDLVFLRRRTGIRGFFIKKLFLDLPLRRAAKITTVSQATKNEIIEYSGIDGDRITVIDNPLSDGFISDDAKPFNAECPVILHIGTAENKNLDNLIKALSGIKCKLRIIGRLDDKTIQNLTQSGTLYENVYGLDEIQVMEEYQNADIVSFCSTYEGFGLPIIEAQAMRTPIITSDLPPMNAVAGLGAALGDPYDVSSITNGLKRIIGDPAFRNMLIENGVENIKRFDGKSIADRYAQIYDQMIESI